VQASFVAEEWIDHALSRSREVENKLAASDRALAKIRKKYKDSLFRLAEAERGHKSAKVALGGAKRQAKELQVLLKKTDEQLSSVKEQIKLQVKELGHKDAKREKAKQVVYDVSMTKTAQSLTTQLRDVARTFGLEV